MAKKSGKESKRSKGSKGSKDKGTKGKGAEAVSFTETLRAGDDFELASLDPRSTPGFDGDKADGEAALAELAPHLAELQERLYAESKAGGTRSLLLIIQGTDTSGKGGIMRHVVGAFDPQGVDITSFKAPTPEELKHPFLWRIRKAVPQPGQIGVFDRSQYEDVLIVRVHDLVPRAQWSRRYAQINAFEKEVAQSGTTIVKVMLHISSDEQKERLTERLDRPDKHWKFNTGDLDERTHWADYQEAYQVAIEKCSTDVAPWFVVPADRKWYARLAVTELVLEHLKQLDPQWPEADFDVEAAKKRLAAMP
ncbi:polyphosphate kinase 2 family protein [Knoellia sp. Soil729]|uniref:polyphosphate kinase 2 family protein n=1 Tax=Knoellia sp. Soil729 TaxID=1736394 RepID=UPI0006F679CD|nr:polyphosphate kinase 2 family protein [Knoellia sp. Soil729]KRE41583.1 polyphosphate kinase (could be polyphosphate AMP phosphotransferase (pap)) [Knoellia sp. Soil729]